MFLTKWGSPQTLGRRRPIAPRLSRYFVLSLLPPSSAVGGLVACVCRKRPGQMLRILRASGGISEVFAATLARQARPTASYCVVDAMSGCLCIVAVAQEAARTRRPLWPSRSALVGSAHQEDVKVGSRVVCRREALARIY